MLKALLEAYGECQVLALIDAFFEHIDLAEIKGGGRRVGALVFFRDRLVEEYGEYLRRATLFHYEHPEWEQGDRDAVAWAAHFKTLKAELIGYRDLTARWAAYQAAMRGH